MMREREERAVLVTFMLEDSHLLAWDGLEGGHFVRRCEECLPVYSDSQLD